MTNQNPPTDRADDSAPPRAARSVLMVRPSAFAHNDVTAPTNRFQRRPGDSDNDPERTAQAATQEFDRLVAALRLHGVDTHVFEGRNTTPLPDEVFPNNWISTHPDGTTVLYPLMAWNRRPERRRDILDQLQTAANGFRISKLVDLTAMEADGHFLEGTGSLVFDHADRTAYACLSPRTHADALREFSQRADYDVIAFEAADADGRAIYHTNVMLALGEEFAIVCPEAIPTVNDRFRLQTRLERSGREIIEFSLAQLTSFVGNIIQLRADNRRLVVMSTQARSALNDEQTAALSRHADAIIATDVATIERHGGGSVRCMIAELLLPRKQGPDGLAPRD